MAAEMLTLIREHQLASVRGARPGVVVSADRNVTLPSWL
jgi:hypothetical protein